MSQETAIALKEWALAIPVMVLLLAPGLGPAWVFCRRRDLSLAWVASLAFAWGVAWTSAVAVVAHLAHLSLAVVIGAYVAAIPFSIWLLGADLRKRGRPSKLDAASPGFLIAIAAWITALVQGPAWIGSDNFFHLAAARSLIATGRPIVTDPFYGLESRSPDPTAGLWNTVQAVVARITSVDVTTVYPGITAFSAFAVTLAFWVLAREFSGSRLAASVATMGYVVAAWYTDFRPFGYPNKASIALAFITLAILCRVCTEPRRRWLLAVGVTGLSALAVHLASGQMELLCAGGMALSLGALSLVPLPAEERRNARRAAARIVGGIALMVLPVSPVLIARVATVVASPVMGEDSFVWAGDQIMRGPLGWRFVTPGGFDFGGPWLFWLTVAIAVFATIHAIRTGDRRSAALVPIVLMAPILCTFPPVSTIALNASSYMIARMAELFRFAPYLAAAWAIGAARSGRGKATRPVLLTRALGWATIVVALIIAVPYLQSTYVQGAGTQRRGAMWSVKETHERDMRSIYGFSTMFEMRRIVGDTYPRVAADADTSYHLMGLVPVTVVASLPSHTPVLLPPAQVKARNDDMVLFFTPGTTREQRADILERWDIDYVFVREYIDGVDTRKEIVSDKALFELLTGNDRVLFFRVDREELDRIIAR